MKLFIDTAEVAQVREAWSWGIIDGVTTNPSHVAKSGRKPSEVYREICDIVNGPVSLETVALDAEGIVKEGVALELSIALPDSPAIVEATGRVAWVNDKRARRTRGAELARAPPRVPRRSTTAR